MIKKVLIVDDNPSISNLYKDRFEFSDFEVRQAWAGETAVQMAEEFQPGAILLDLMLPRMTGEEVLDQLKTNPKTKDIPVIVWTALFQQDTDRARMQKKADDYVVKTEIIPRDLVNKVEEMIGKTKNNLPDSGENKT